MMQNRTHTCGELRLSDAGKQVKISGWMENVRVVSANLAFVVVRDFYGTTQVVAETEDMVNTFKAITKESTISVEGVVRERDSKTGKMATGDIEIVPAKVEVLGRCQHSELPFQINRSREADEAQRLKYRYLDLRNPAVKKNIILRCNVVAALRMVVDLERIGDEAVTVAEQTVLMEDVPGRRILADEVCGMMQRAREAFMRAMDCFREGNGQEALALRNCEDEALQNEMRIVQRLLELLLLQLAQEGRNG